MPTYTVNTQSNAYTTRHAQFIDIVQFYTPRITEYFTLDEDGRKAWRQADPFLKDILRLARYVETKALENTVD